mmetsp:Transcript_4497/g.10595  ORF Transcript_4497/g.10595 Transcript_4497/m.10595 type:complete len:548 (+) Transcript_4497:112-1755(+)
MFDLDELENKDPSPDADEALKEEVRAAVENLQHKMFNIRRDACKVLGKAGRFAEPHLQQLKDISEKDDDLDVKKAARNAIRDLREQGVVLKKEDSSKPPDPKQQQIDEQNQVWAQRAGRQLGEKSWNARKDGCKRMGTVGKAAEPFLPKLRELMLQDERPEVRKAAEVALKKLKDDGIFLPEPAQPEVFPEVAKEQNQHQAEEDAWRQGAEDFAELGQQAAKEEFREMEPAPVPAAQRQQVQPTGPEWWETMPGGPAWDQDARYDLDPQELIDQKARERVIPKEEKVEYDRKSMMREAAEAAGEELSHTADSVRRDACKALGGLGKFAKAHVETLKEMAKSDPALDVRVAAKTALKELRDDGVVPAASASSQGEAQKPVTTLAIFQPAKAWIGPVAQFEVFEEVIPMELERESMTPAEIVQVWESWGVHGASRARFEVKAGEGIRPAKLNPREDVVPISPAVIKVEAKVGSILTAIAGALREKLAQEDAYREERMKKRKDPRSRLWIEGPPMLPKHMLLPSAPPPQPVAREGGPPPRRAGAQAFEVD